MPRAAEPTETGIDVYPRLPVPKAGKRESEPAIKRPGGGGGKKLALAALGAALVGAVAGFVIRPLVTTDARIPELEAAVGEAGKAAETQKARAEELDKQLRAARADKATAETKLADATRVSQELAGKVAAAESKAKEQTELSAKLQATVDKSIGLVSADGEEITLRLVDQVLFKTLDDQLTDRGKKVLDQVAVALKEISDKQIWVQGHTDDQPIGRLPPPKPVKRGKPEVPPGPKFATNWELSAARALTVVHYLQDVAKVDPARLAALAFGQYRPVSKTNKAANRRIEIVLYPKPVVKK